jgi:P27 family predicted phage terminase small subunit
MGRRGPPAKPTALKIANGNPGHRPLNTKEPTPEIEAPECPTFLDKIARIEWDRIVPILISHEVLSRMDLAALAAYCQSYSRWQEAEKELTKGTTYESKGRFYPKPQLKISQDERRLMHRFLTEFGLTPASRTRVQIDNEKPGDSFQAFLGSRPAS